MELIIKPFTENSYPRKGIVIRGKSPLTWLSEIEFLGVDLNQVNCYAIPSNEPNVLYGCLLVFQNIAPKESGKNSYFQCVDNKLFIPENTILYPKINQEDWQNINCDFLIMHPDFGTVKLNEQIDWISLLQESEKSNDIIRKASKGVKIPQKIESYTVEMSDDKILESLQKPQTEEEWMKDLPFNLKKVMAGNKKEIEKYLQYLEKYPDRAADLGVPLDIAGTSRGDGFAKFKFGNSWLGGLFGQKGGSSGTGNSGTGNSKWIFFVALIIISAIRVSLINSNKSESVKESSGNIQNLPETYEAAPPPMMAVNSGVTDIDMKIDSLYGDERRKLMNESILANALRIDYNNKNSYQEYLKKGGKPIEKIAEESDSIQNRIITATDSLKLVYGKKITKFLVQNEAKFRKKIKDSLKKKGSGIPADKGVVSTILKKKQILIEDSLGRLYGTKEYIEPKIDPDKAIKAQTLDKEMSYSKKDISFLEIIYLIAGIIGIVGLYSYFFRKKSLDMGGSNVPSGIKIFLMAVLVAMLVYIFYPLIEMYGYNWFVWILVICIILLMYSLFSEDKNILNSKKDE